MSQPKWKLIANLGDKNPIDYGGFFIYVDETGVYPAEAEMLEVDEDSREPRWQVLRIVLEPCTYINGVLSDNKFHPEHAAWFAKPEAMKAERPQDTTYLSNIAASYCDTTVAELVLLLCSADPLDRANAYRMVGEYHGFINFDQTPITFTSRREVEKRYADDDKSLW